ncbi:HAD-IA family hydrolase [Candidatus Woesearchaeota archaeon]|nr:HAD-IA family hydrolase [Candidatus Woesearchaeota archaeon]
MIKAIIFDYWNTLTNCEVTEKTLKNATLKSYNYLKSKNYNITFDELLERRKSGFLKYNEWAVKNRKELTPEESFKKYIFYDINIEEEDIKKVIEINEKYDHKHKFKENLKETLIKLKNKGYKLGIISNAWTRLTLFHLNQDGIRNLFDVIILSCDYGVRKPSKEIFNITIKKLNVNKEECIFVGDDHEDDIYGANNFGIFCTLGMKPIKIKPKIEYMPQYYIEEIYEIEDLINEIDQNIINAPISIGDLVDKVQGDDYIILTKGGMPKAALVDVAYLAKLEFIKL